MSPFARWISGSLAGLLLLAVALPADAQEQENGEPSAEAADSEAAAPYYPEAARVPFGPGERLTYQLKMGAFGVGEGSLEVAGVDTVQSRPSYYLTMRLDGGFLFADVHDFFESWLDLRTLVSRRFRKKIHEVNYQDDRHYAFYPEERRWERTDEEKGGRMLSSFPLDDVAFLYYVRTLDLTPGREYRFDRYFKEEGNPVVVRVLRRDTVEVPAGTFPTVVVRPSFNTEGMFREGGEAELHFTDDEKRHLVYMRVKIPVMRSMTLHLRSVEEGRPVWERPPERAEDPQPDGSPEPPEGEEGEAPGGR